MIEINPKINKILKEINIYATAHHNTTWCVPWEEGEFLYKIVKEKKPKSILECGTSIGFSTLWLAAAAEEYEGVIKTIDIDEGRQNQAREYIQKAGLENVTFILGEVIKTVKEMQEQFDLIFLDCGKEHYLNIIPLLEKNNCIQKGTIIVADNTKIIEGKKNEKLIEYLTYLRKNYVSKAIDMENGMEMSVRT